MTATDGVTPNEQGETEATPHMIMVSDEGAGSMVPSSLVHDVCALAFGAAQDLGCPPFELNVVLPADFDVAVAMRMPSGRFDSSRLGGIVHGKTVPSLDDYSVVDVIMRVDQGFGASLYPQFVATLAHELAHALIGRMRGGDGCSVADDARMVAFAGDATAFAIQAIDEVRCNLFGDAILRHLLREFESELGQSMSIWLLHGDAYERELRGAVDRLVYPGWPDTVDEYRSRRITLDEMLERLFRSASQVFMLIAHAHSIAISGHQGSPLDSVNSPGVDLYLAPAWRRILSAVDGSLIIPRFEEIGGCDARVKAAGVEALIGMWGKLGLDARFLNDDGDMWVDVTAPTR